MLNVCMPGARRPREPENSLRSPPDASVGIIVFVVNQQRKFYGPCPTADLKWASLFRILTSTTAVEIPTLIPDQHLKLISPLWAVVWTENKEQWPRCGPTLLSNGSDMLVYVTSDVRQSYSGLNVKWSTCKSVELFLFSIFLLNSSELYIMYQKLIKNVCPNTWHFIRQISLKQHFTETAAWLGTTSCKCCFFVFFFKCAELNLQNYITMLKK